MHTLTLYYSTKPRLLFLTDAVGAATTACIMLLLSRYFFKPMGVPGKILLFFSNIGWVYCVAAMMMTIFSKHTFSKPLKVLSIANATYVITMLVVVAHFVPTISAIGCVYFSGEAIIILLLARLEWLVANCLIHK